MLRSLDGQQAHCTMRRQFTFKIGWVCERDYSSGTKIQLRVDRFRPFLNWHFVRLEREKVDIARRWKNYLSPGEVMTNRENILLEGQLLYGKKCGKEAEILLVL